MVTVRRLAWLLLTVAILGTNLGAQRQGSGSDRTNLIVRFYVARGGSLPRMVQVDLLATSGATIGQGVLDSSSTIAFSVLNPGEYAVRVSGPGIENATYSIVVQALESTHVESLELRLASRADHADGAHASVSASDLNVPPKARNEMGKAAEALKLDNFVEARKHYEKAIQIYPQYAVAHNDLGVVFLRLGDREKARDAFTKAIELNQTYSRAYVNLARIDAGDKKYREAEELLKKALSAEPDSPETLFLLSNAQLQNGQYADAVTTARKVNALAHRGFEGAHVVCAMALSAENLNSEAAEEYRTFLKEAPNSSMVPQARAALAAIEATNKK